MNDTNDISERFIVLLNRTNSAGTINKIVKHFCKSKLLLVGNLVLFLLKDTQAWLCYFRNLLESATSAEQWGHTPTRYDGGSCTYLSQTTSTQVPTECLHGAPHQTDTSAQTPRNVTKITPGEILPLLSSWIASSGLSHMHSLCGVCRVCS